jgi:molybdenum-dependent DNA-binding transcriptional regulator ModE
VEAFTVRTCKIETLMECDPCIWKRSMSDGKYMESVLYRLFHELMEHCSISVGKKLLEWPYGTVWNGQF